jgi:ABC-type multidrug transport system fused ATPase/permease subunit
MLFTFNNIQAITFLITSFVDLFEIIVRAVSVSFSILPLMKTTIKSILFASKSAVKKSEEEEEEDQMKK